MDIGHLCGTHGCCDCPVTGGAMQEPELITSLPLNYITNRPLASNLQWSEDGQIFVVTRAVIYILASLVFYSVDSPWLKCGIKKTPAQGFEYDTSSAKTAAVSENNALPLGWYKGWLDLDKTVPRQWSDGKPMSRLVSAMFMWLMSTLRLGHRFFGLIGYLLGFHCDITL